MSGCRMNGDMPAIVTATEVVPRAQDLGVDEVGNWSYVRKSATVVFTRGSVCYERSGVICTSNSGSGEWGELLRDIVIALTMLDRLPHHRHVLNICGEKLPSPGEGQQ